MKIWVDADACPAAIKDILFRAAKRTGIAMTLVANKAMYVPRLEQVDFVLVGAGLDVADNEIIRQMNQGDLVITADIPLAAEVVEKGGIALNPRGERYTAENIRSRLSMRDFMDALRSSGVNTGGPSAFSDKDKQAFANQLDQILTRYVAGSKKT